MDRTDRLGGPAALTREWGPCSIPHMQVLTHRLAPSDRVASENEDKAGLTNHSIPQER